MKLTTILLLCCLLTACAVDENTMNFRFVSGGQSVTDAAIVTQILRGNSLKPLSPVNIMGHRDTANSLFIEWTRRSRLGGGLRPYVGVPLAEELENYDVEILTSGNVLKRTFNVTGGGSQAVMLVGSIHPECVDQNSLTAVASGSDIQSSAYSFQELKAPGTWVEANLNAPGTNFVQIGLYESRVKEQLFRNLTSSEGFQQYVQFTQANDLFGSIPGLRVYENGVVKYSSGSLGNVTSPRIRILLSGTEVRYYWDYTGPGSVPFYISRVPPTFPLVATANVIKTTGSPSLNNMNIGILFAPSTIYSASQQIEDFGSVQNPIRVRVYQVSAILGRGPYRQADL